MAARSILHVDMDAFFAAIEQRDRPELRGRPVLVGGAAKARGVVSTASYEARAYGARSAMPMATALRLCPHAVVISPRMRHYRQVSAEIFRLFDAFTPVVEPVSVDEAFLDVTGCEVLFGPVEHPPRRRWNTLLGWNTPIRRKNGVERGNPLSNRATAAPAGEPYPTHGACGGTRSTTDGIARQLKERIRAETGLTASVGVAPNKFLAKLASDLEEPDGLVVIAPERVQEMLDPLPDPPSVGAPRCDEGVKG